MSVFFRGSTRRAAGIVVGLYAAFSLAWIFFSDAALAHLATDAVQLTRWQNYKGWAFVSFSSLLLAGLLHQVLRERDRVAQQLARANRSLMMINQCRAVLMRATNEAGLLQEICRVVVQFGGYRMAWVGQAEHDEQRTVRPVAQAGFERDYLESVKIAWSDTEHGRGPTGTAIRTGEPVVARNIPGDPAYGPWRAAAIRRGYASSVALPLPPAAAEKFSWGALSIYADEADGFDDIEINLLKGLAKDLAFGLEALRERRARMGAEELLQRSEREFRLLFDHNPLPIWVFDIETLRFLAVNEAAVQHYGYTREEFLKMTIKDIRPGEDVPDMLRTVGRLPKGLDFAGVWRHRKKNGQCILVEITSHVIEFQGRPSELVLANDVTARCEAEAALREGEVRLRLAMDAANLGSFEWDMVRDQLKWSRQHEALWGYGRGEFPGTYAAFADRLHPEDVAGLGAEVARSIAERNGFAAEYRVVWPDGSIHWVAGFGRFEFDADGQPVRMRGVVKEITERKQAEERLRELADRLEAVQEEERTRIAREVHDVLGQLLTGLKMDLAWLERRRAQIADDELRGAMGERVREATKLADTLIESVQKISSELRPSVLDNLGLPAAIGFEAARFARRSGISCEVAPLPESLQLPPDVATEAFRIFQEVLTNAARHARARKVQVRLTRGGKRAVLEIQDDGCGITDEQQSNPRALGLLGMRERARRMKGTLTIRGESGRGTLVRLEIPLETPV